MCARSQVATKQSSTAVALVQSLDLSTLNYNLAQAGLPSCTLQSIAVQVPSGAAATQGSTTVVAAVVGSLGGLLLLVLGGSIWYKLHTQPASRRLMCAEAGILAGQHDLPYELRGKYEAVRVLGSGAFGVVIEAWQMSTTGKRTVRRAIKLVHCTARRFSSQELRRLEREVAPPPPTPDPLTTSVHV